MKSSASPGPRTEPRRLIKETRSAFKTTELIVFVVSVQGVLIASAVTSNVDDGHARKAWLYVPR